MIHQLQSLLTFSGKGQQGGKAEENIKTYLLHWNKLVLHESDHCPLILLISQLTALVLDVASVSSDRDTENMSHLEIRNASTRLASRWILVNCKL